MYAGNFREKSKQNYPVIINKINLPLFLTSTLNHVYELHNKYALAELNTEVQPVS